MNEMFWYRNHYLDDWETEASYENNQTENEQRWGKDAVSNRAGAIE